VFFPPFQFPTAPQPTRHAGFTGPEAKPGVQWPTADCQTSTRSALGANTLVMGKYALIVAGLLVTSQAVAQSRVDRVPETSPEPQLPLKPTPSNEVSDAPERTRSTPELILPPAEPATRLVPGATDSDSLTGHLLPNASIGYTAGFGNIDSSISTHDSLASGATIGIGIGYGVSRNVELGLAASLAPLSGGNSCTTCEGRLTDALLYVGYHLVQGTKFDPWVRFGVGVAGLHLTGAAKNFDYVGLSWANVMFGGDWYASKYIGFGPVLSCALQSYLHTPADRSVSVAERLTVGLRFTFDVNGH
jgi:hypothetical protein